jgi:NAD+ dependent glucose-6-phosphate dehydrogenase
VHVIVTGAAGRIGNEVLDELSGSHEVRPLDRRPLPRPDAVLADLARTRRWARPRFAAGFRAARWMESFHGAEVVVHLAADARWQAPWRAVLRDNVEAAWNVFEAAAAHGVRRIVFASSHWAVKALEDEAAAIRDPALRPLIGSATPPRPLTPYGASKGFGEMAGRMLVDEGRLRSFVAVRIGMYRPEPPEKDELRRRWIGRRDIRSLFRRCVEAEFEGFHVVYGVSAQPGDFDLSHTRELLEWEPREVP